MPALSATSNANAKDRTAIFVWGKTEDFIKNIFGSDAIMAHPEK
jgi:hypothetical protein